MGLGIEGVFCAQTQTFKQAGTGSSHSLGLPLGERRTDFQKKKWTGKLTRILTGALTSILADNGWHMGCKLTRILTGTGWAN